MTEGYVGITTTGLSNRLRQHKCRMNGGKSHPLYSAMRKYRDFVASVVLVGDLDYCLYVESSLRPDFNIGYNLKPGGDRTMLGFKHSDETKLKISEANKQRKPVSDETLKRMSEAHLGILHTESTRKRMSEIAKARELNLTTLNLLQEGRNKRVFPWQQGGICLDLWKNATSIFDAMCLFPEHGTHRLSKVVGFTPSQLQVIFRNIRNGWNPHICQEWQKTFNKNIDTEVSKEGE